MAASAEASYDAIVKALDTTTNKFKVLVESLPLPAGASTETTLAALAADIALIKAKTNNLDVLLSTRTKPADTQVVSAAALPLPSGASTGAKQDTGNTSLANILTELGAKTEPGDTQTIAGTVQPGNTPNTVPWLMKAPTGTRSDTFTATGNGTTVDMTTGPVQTFSIQVKGTGAAATSCR